MTHASSDDELLDLLVGSIDSEQNFDVDSLIAARPHQAAAIRRLAGALESYRRTLHKLRAPLSANLRPGDRLGDFEIEALIGRGGMGEVYRARQTSLGRRTVALKVLLGTEHSAVELRRFEREALHLAELHHRNLAEVYGVGRHGELLYIAMRLIEGCTLADPRLRPTPATDLERVALRRRFVGWIADVAEALAEVHRAGLVHRDVKPSNVIVQGSPSDGQSPDSLRDAVLVDFGLARRIDTNGVTRTGASAATPGFAPPEQLLGRDVDARADVFSLGVTLHDLLTDRQVGERMQASLGLESLRSIDPTIDADLEAIVAKAVEPEATWRYASAEGMLMDLRAWLDGEQVTARKAPLVERVTRWTRRHPWGVARLLLGVSAVAALVLGSVGLVDARASALSSRAAYEAGDLRALRDSSERITPLLRGALLARSEVADAAERLLGTRSGDVLGDIARTFADSDPDAALPIAATHARRHGLAAEQLVERFLRHSLQKAQHRPGDANALATRRATLLLLARLFYERPDEDAAATAASAMLRAALLELRSRDAELSRHERLYLVSALSGCGTADDAPALLAWALHSAPGSEEQRLGLLACERIVRRSHACESWQRVDAVAMLIDLTPMARSTFEPFGPDEIGPTWLGVSIPAAVRVSLRALAHMAGRQGASVRIDESFPASWPDPFEHSSRGAHERLSLMAALRDPRLLEWLEDDATALRPSATPYLTGFACALMGDESLSTQWRARWTQDPRAIDGRTPVAVFDSGARDAGTERRGHAALQLLDADTHLGADQGADAEDLVALPAPHVAEGAASPAVWDFLSEPPRLAGAATRASFRGARFDRDGRGAYVVLSRFGKSSVAVEFEVRPGELVRAPVVLLEHLGAARSYYPFAGEVDLAIRLDGVALEHRLLQAGAFRTTVIELPEALLPVGTHRLEFLLGPSTTTTYRIRRVEFHAAPPATRGTGPASK